MGVFLDTPIRIQPQPQLQQVQVLASHEPFVDVAEYTNGKIRVNMQYAKAGISGAVNNAYLRQTVAEKLMQAADFLPKGYCFEVLDAWRPYMVQLSLYNDYRDQILQRSLQVLSEEELKAKTCEFVSFPDRNKEISYVHSSGGAVHLRIIGPEGIPLDMGSEFDAFTERSYTAWYENRSENQKIRDNRRLLHNVLCSCGFTNYPAEWWHYDYGDSFWSCYTTEPVKYISVFDVKEVLLCE